MSSQNVSQAIDQLASQPTLSILTLAEPILSPSPSTTTTQTTPQSLLADLSHYRDLFSKLRFSYLEQVTKERFLKAIVADPPELVDAEQNARLEDDLKSAKAALKAKKVAMEDMVESLERMGKELVGSHEILALQTTQLASLPPSIAHLEDTIAALGAAAADADAAAATCTDPDLRLPLPATRALLTEREAELADLEAQIAALRDTSLPAVEQRVLVLERDLRPLEERKRRAVDEAREAQRLRGGGGAGGLARARELEERGRWLGGVERGLKVMLDV